LTPVVHRVYGHAVSTTHPKEAAMAENPYVQLAGERRHLTEHEGPMFGCSRCSIVAELVTQYAVLSDRMRKTAAAESAVVAARRADRGVRGAEATAELARSIEAAVRGRFQLAVREAERAGYDVRAELVAGGVYARV
jgi:hypothetical protein